MDTALIRLFTARMKLGMFDPPDMDPYSKIDPKELDSAEHRALARKLADEAIVLLKNDGTLPLKSGDQEDRRLWVRLPTRARPLIGNYAGLSRRILFRVDGRPEG